jgi:predicted negative regulator of RcsB-dependent stress response
MHPALKKKSTLFLLLILAILTGVFCVQTYLGKIHQTQAQSVATGFGAALYQLQNSPPGVARVETFIAALKTIESATAPAGVKEALRDYIAAVQQSLDAAKAGRDMKSYDPAIVRAKQKLSDSVRDYD